MLHTRQEQKGTGILLCKLLNSFSKGINTVSRTN